MLPTYWIFIATGATGALTLLFLLRRLHYLVVTPPSISAHFSPKGGVTEAVVIELGRARREILVLAYSFTSEPISKALVDAKLAAAEADAALELAGDVFGY